MKVKIVNKSKFELPSYQTTHSAGMDLRANIEGDDVVCMILPGQRSIIPTGLFIELPEGYEAQIRSRSGLAAKSGLMVLNSPGTIDSDYRGEIKVILFNSSNTGVIINPGDRIAQMVVSKFEKVEWEAAEQLSETERGEGGFNSTGVK